MNNAYQNAKEVYASVGVDTEAALAKLEKVSISIHCWQGDDVTGFENSGSLSGGIAATGNYPGKARNPEELMADFSKALTLIPGKHRINLHSIYAITDQKVDRDQLKPAHFKKWVEFAKEKGLGIDFNPTFFSHPLAEDSLTLSNPDEKIRTFWINHGKACRKIAEYFGKELGTPCLHNIWIPDGYKNIPADRMGPRARLKDSLDQILAEPIDKKYVLDAVESKVFGLGLEAYTVGSHEFYMNYAAQKGCLCLLDNGHYHPTEVVSDKIPAMLLFSDKLALHVTRPIRWDSDHVVIFDDELREIAKEIVRCNALDRVLIGLDYFDASINRVSSWVIGTRNMQKALLNALLMPHAEMKALQDEGNFSKVLAMQETLKSLPLGEVWNEFCRRHDVATSTEWYAEVEKYEREVLLKRV